MASELIDLLEREAEAERQRLLTEARERADQVRQQAQAEAQALLEAQRRRLAAAMEAARVRAQGVARLRATSAILEAKDEVLEEVFRRAGEELDRLSREPARYGPVLRQLLREAVEGFGGPVVVECPEQDVRMVEAAAGELGIPLVQVRPDSQLRAGVRVLSEDGRFVVENTLASRMQRARQMLLGEVANVLWRE